MQRRGAFTLIELLVVISIIALLIALLLPALSQARRVSKELQCGADVRSLSTSSIAYAADNDGVLPDTSRQPSTDALIPQPYWMWDEWRDELEKNYGVQRSTWYYTDNEAWNRDLFYWWNTGNRDTAWGMVMGRFYFAGTLVNSMGFTSSLLDPSVISTARKTFATHIEDTPVYSVVWTDLTRRWPAGSASWTTPGDPDRRGANHLLTDTSLYGSHLGHLDGHVNFASGSDVQHRATYGGSPAEIWW